MKNKTLIIGSVIVAIGLMVFVGWYGKGDAPSELHSQKNDASILGGDSSGTAPNFSLEDLNGEIITLAEYRGVKPVVLDFWASWCPNCRRDMPNLNRFYKKYKDDVEVIGINLQERRSTVERYISSAGITFPIVLDPSGTASRAYGARYTNFHVLIDKEGNIVRTIPGDIRESDITALIDKS